MAARGLHIPNVNYVVNYDFPGSLSDVSVQHVVRCFNSYEIVMLKTLFVQHNSMCIDVDEPEESSHLAERFHCIHRRSSLSSPENLEPWQIPPWNC